MRGLESIVDLKDMIDEGLRKSKKLKEVYIKIHWKDIVGDLSTKSFPREVKNGVLIVICESSILIHHMNLKKGVYMETIDRIIKDQEYIKGIKFLTGSLKETEMRLFGGNDE